MPAAHRLGRDRWLAEAELAEGRQRLGIIFRAGEGERASLAGEVKLGGFDLGSGRLFGKRPRCIGFLRLRDQLVK